MEATTDKPTTAVQVAEPDPKTSIWARMASTYGLTVKSVRETMMNTLMPKRDGKLIATESDMAAALIIADVYKLNPFAKEIYFTPGKGGGILSIVGFDGWVKIANAQANFNGWSYSTKYDEKSVPVECTVTVYFRDNRVPLVITELWRECRRNTDPWRDMPSRMLRNRTFSQAVRCAFGIGGIMLEDEAEDMIETPHVTVSSVPLSTPPALASRIAERAAAINGSGGGEARIVEVRSESSTEPAAMTQEESDKLDREAAAEEAAREGKGSIS